MTDTTNIKKIPIESYLKVEPAKRKNGSGMYHSPLRDDSNASFSVDYNKNLWHDFGTGEGGDIIDLVIKLKGCSFLEAVAELTNGGYFSFQRQNLIDNQPDTKSEIISVDDVSDRALLDYCLSRGISGQVVKDNLKQVLYKPNNQKFVNFGMQNSLNDWELIGLNRFKRVMGRKSYTFVSGRYHSECSVFEGIFDYLSALMMGGGLSMPKFDCVVLHSVNTLKQAVDLLGRYSVVHSFMDNDDAGRRCADDIKILLSGRSEVKTYSFYDAYNDLNDYWMAHK